jgi:hypothetical protein
VDQAECAADLAIAERRTPLALDTVDARGGVKGTRGR